MVFEILSTDIKLTVTTVMSNILSFCEFHSHSCFPDINECEFSNYICQFQCVNQPGGYQCVCPDGYQLQGTRMCQGTFQFLPGSWSGFWRYSLTFFIVWCNRVFPVHTTINSWILTLFHPDNRYKRVWNSTQLQRRWNVLELLWRIPLLSQKPLPWAICQNRRRVCLISW